MSLQNDVHYLAYLDIVHSIQRASYYWQLFVHAKYVRYVHTVFPPEFWRLTAILKNNT
jgi:hypothetical protein